MVFTSTSSDPDGTLVEQVWDLNGDGNYDNGGGATALRSFADAGSYVVGLRVTDNAGLVSFDSQTLTVVPAPGTPPVHDATSGTTTAEPVPGRAADGPDHRARDARAAAARESTRADEDHDPLYRSQLPVQEAGAGGPEWRQRRERRPPCAFGASSGCCRPGVRVRVYVTKRGEVGKYTKFRFRAGNAPVRTDSCVMPGSWAPAECPVL